MKDDDLAECKHTAELLDLRQRVKNQRDELDRLNALVAELRKNFSGRLWVCQRVMSEAAETTAKLNKMLAHVATDIAGDKTST